MRVKQGSGHQRSFKRQGRFQRTKKIKKSRISYIKLRRKRINEKIRKSRQEWLFKEGRIGSKPRTPRGLPR
jgi:hypothetical protein